MCVGDFDFIPGSTHVLGAPPLQSDFLGKTWLFTGFSNGLGQNSIYTADFNVGVADTFTANFVAAVPTQVVTSPPGLTVNVDGQDDSTGSQRLWGESQTHHLIAPPTQTDSSGRPWKFVSWSNGGTAEQNYTVPAGQIGLYLVANYEPLGKLQVNSVPSGLPFMVDGAACTTPCTLLDKPTGATVQVVAPPSVVPDAFSRYTFGSWNGGSTTPSFQVTIGDQVQVFTATYQTFYKLTVTSQPANLVNFQFTPPPSSDGFFAGGTQVSVTAFPNNGYTFKRWSGDLSGTNLTASVVMNGPRFAVAILNGFPYVSGVQNSAGATPSNTVGPGSVISIVGNELAAATTSSPDGELSQALDDVWVTLNSRLMALFNVSPELINAQLFSDLPDGDYTLTVHRSAQADASKTFTVRRDSPGLFQCESVRRHSTISAIREDGSELTADNAAAKNETISIYGTGFGLYDHPLVDGFPTPDTGDWNLVDPITVTIGGQTYTPVSARALNGFAGLVVLKVKLTGTLPSGLVDLKVTVNGVDSNTVKLPIQGVAVTRELAHKKRRLIDGRVHRDVEEPDHHLVPALVPIAHVDRGVRIAGVRGRVVVGRDPVEPGSFLERHRLRQTVVELPVEIVRLHAQQRLGQAVRQDPGVLEFGPPQVHVREESQQQRVVRQSAPHADPEIALPRRDQKFFVVHLQRENALGRRLLGEHHPDLDPILHFLAVGREMNLEHQVGSGMDQLGHARRIDIGRAARRIHGQDVSLGRPSCPGIAGLADVNHHMVHDGTVAGTNLDRLHPAILFESRRRDEVLILDCAFRRNLERLRHLDHFVGRRIRRAYIPSLGPDLRRRSVRFPALLCAGIHPVRQRVAFGGGQANGRWRISRSTDRRTTAASCACGPPGGWLWPTAAPLDRL